MPITDAQREKLRTLPARLKARLTGQDMAIDLVPERLQHGELGLTTHGRPKASFLFLGSTVVGKTELTLRFTEELIGPGQVVRLDMREYQTAARPALGAARCSSMKSKRRIRACSMCCCNCSMRRD